MSSDTQLPRTLTGEPCVVVRVNDRDLTCSDLMEALLARRGCVVLRQLVSETLIEQATAKRGVVVSPAEVDAELTRLRRQSPSQVGETMKASGESWERFRAALRLRLLVRKMAQQEAKICENEVRAYYERHRSQFVHPERVHLWNILLDTRQNAEAVRKVLQAGGDFKGMARAFSNDPATKTAGGDMGIIAVTALTPPLAAAVRKMRPGQISPVIAAPDGWYLLKLTQRLPASQKSYAEVRGHIRSMLVEKKLTALQSNLVKQLWSEADIAIMDTRFR